MSSKQESRRSYGGKQNRIGSELEMERFSGKLSSEKDLFICSVYVVKSVFSCFLLRRL